VRVLGISSSTDRQTSAGFLKAGAHDFVSRPFVLEELQCRIASNVEVLDQLRQLQDLAARDFLTGLFNRRHFFARGRQLVCEAREMGLPISVAILDIDHFKRLNDRHGHDGGDRALTAVARTLSVMAERGFNLLARIGGEEFAIIFPGADLAEAGRLCSDIRAAIAGTPFVVNGESLPLTVSIGVAALAPDALLETCLGQADEALYAAKQDGRNRVRSAA
jgi:diguanylate cyclase (GGDEF)-like protein